MKTVVKFVKIVGIVNVVNKVKQYLTDFYLIHFKKNLSKDEATRLIVNAELKKYGVDYNYVIEHEKINDKFWYEYYTFNSKEEYEKWEKFCKRIIKKTIPIYTDSEVNIEFSYINLFIGLKNNYEH
jgi:hypothetical protein